MKRKADWGIIGELIVALLAFMLREDKGLALTIALPIVAVGCLFFVAVVYGRRKARQ